MDTTLDTGRLLLRRFTEQDVDLLVALDSDPEVMRYLGDGRPTRRDRIEREVLPAFLACDRRFGHGFWAGFEKASGGFVGWFSLRPDADRPGVAELGYRLRRAVWGRGYATEGSRALIRLGFTALGVVRVYAQTMAVNLASRRVMEKAGLRYVRTFHLEWEHPLPGSEHGEVEYGLDRAEWTATSTADSTGGERHGPVP